MPMKRIAEAVALIFWILLSSAFLTRYWITHHQMLPPFPRSVAEYLVTLYGAQNAEDVSDLEILVGMVINVPIMSIFTVLMYRVLAHKD